MMVQETKLGKENLVHLKEHLWNISLQNGSETEKAR